MSENINHIVATVPEVPMPLPRVAVPTPETTSGSGAQIHGGVNMDLINRINSIRVKPMYQAPVSEAPRTTESTPTDTLPGTMIGGWVYEGSAVVRGDRGNNVVYTKPTEVVRVSKAVGNGAKWTKEMPAGEFESWKATQVGGRVGRLMTESGAMTNSGVIIPGRR